MKKEVLKKIIEYAGIEYSFLINFLDGGYENYVEQNLDKIIYKKSFGKYVLRKEIFNVKNKKEHVLIMCEKTLSYIKK